MTDLKDLTDKLKQEVEQNWQMRRPSYRDVEVGDVVLRLLAGVIPMSLIVTKVDDKLIYCGTDDAPGTMEPVHGWTFDRDTGVEDIPMAVSFLTAVHKPVRT